MSGRSRRVASCAVILLVGCSSTVTTTPSPLPPPAITSAVTTAAVAPGSSTTVTSTSEAPRPAGGHIAAFIEELAADGGFSGSALIGFGDDVVWRFASGLADRTENRPNEVDTKFNLGSMSKMFTAVAVLQLVEAGDVAMDDTIADHLSGYGNAEVANTVTIRHLLTHTSGMGDTFTPLFAEDPNRYRSNADFLPLFVDVPLASEPGASFSYSNAGFVVLGLIIEQVTGRDYYDYVRDAIFTPAGMVDTDSYALEDEVPNLAMGYTTLDIDGRPTGVLSENAPLMPGRGFAAGGGYSTTEDLLRFRNALLGHRLLTPGFTEQLIAGQGAMAPGWEYGYGFMIRTDDGSVGHTGGAPGICSFMSMYPESGYTVVVLSNSDADCREILAYVHANPPATPSAGPGPRLAVI